MSEPSPEARIIGALTRDSLTGGHAVLLAWSVASESEWWLATAGRPEVLPFNLEVSHIDFSKPPRERYQVKSLAEVPLDLEWEPFPRQWLERVTP